MRQFLKLLSKSFTEIILLYAWSCWLLSLLQGDKRRNLYFIFDESLAMDNGKSATTAKILFFMPRFH